MGVYVSTGQWAGGNNPMAYRAELWADTPTEFYAFAFNLKLDATWVHTDPGSKYPFAYLTENKCKAAGLHGAKRVKMSFLDWQKQNKVVPLHKELKRLSPALPLPVLTRVTELEIVKSRITELLRTFLHPATSRKDLSVVRVALLKLCEE